jgi:hypothetical protein
MLLLLLAGASSAPVVETRLGSVTITSQARLSVRASSSIVIKK